MATTMHQTNSTNGSILHPHINKIRSVLYETSKFNVNAYLPSSMIAMNHEINTILKKIHENTFSFPFENIQLPHNHSDEIICKLIAMDFQNENCAVNLASHKPIIEYPANLVRKRFIYTTSTENLTTADFVQKLRLGMLPPQVRIMYYILSDVLVAISNLAVTDGKIYNVHEYIMLYLRYLHRYLRLDVVAGFHSIDHLLLSPNTDDYTMNPNSLVQKWIKDKSLTWYCRYPLSSNRYNVACNQTKSTNGDMGYKVNYEGFVSLYKDNGDNPSRTTITPSSVDNTIKVQLTGNTGIRFINMNVDNNLANLTYAAMLISDTPHNAICSSNPDMWKEVVYNMDVIDNIYELSYQRITPTIATRLRDTTRLVDMRDSIIDSDTILGNKIKLFDQVTFCMYIQGIIQENTINENMQFQYVVIDTCRPTCVRLMIHAHKLGVIQNLTIIGTNSITFGTELSEPLDRNRMIEQNNKLEPINNICNTKSGLYVYNIPVITGTFSASKIEIQPYFYNPSVEYQFAKFKIPLKGNIDYQATLTMISILYKIYTKYTNEYCTGYPDPVSAVVALYSSICTETNCVVLVKPRRGTYPGPKGIQPEELIEAMKIFNDPIKFKQILSELDTPSIYTEGDFYSVGSETKKRNIYIPINIFEVNSFKLFIDKLYPEFRNSTVAPIPSIVSNNDTSIQSTPYVNISVGILNYSIDIFPLITPLAKEWINRVTELMCECRICCLVDESNEYIYCQQCGVGVCYACYLNTEHQGCPHCRTPIDRSFKVKTTNPGMITPTPCTLNNPGILMVYKNGRLPTRINKYTTFRSTTGTLPTCMLDPDEFHLLKPAHLNTTKEIYIWLDDQTPETLQGLIQSIVYRGMHRNIILRPIGNLEDIDKLHHILNQSIENEHQKYKHARLDIINMVV